MKLSEAMMLGSVTCKMVPGDWNSCALGCAGNAVGIANTVLPGDRIGDLKKMWPWTIKENSYFFSDDACRIYSLFDREVCDGKMTLEQLADYVKTVEPSCGDCNRFECACVSEAVPEAKEVPCATA